MGASYKRPYQQQEGQGGQQQYKRRQPGQGFSTRQGLRLGQLFNRADSFADLQQLVQERGAEANALELSAAYYKLGQLCQRNSSLAHSAAAQELLQQLDQLLPNVQQQLSSKPRDLSNIIWACAYAQHTPLIKVWLPAFLQHSTLVRANAFDISNVVWALGYQELQLGGQQLQQLSAAYTAQLHSAIPQGTANVLRGVASVQQQVAPDQLQLMVAALVNQLDRADPQAISNTVWAVGKMGQKLPQQQLGSLLTGFVSKLDQAKPQEISNTLLGVVYMEQQVSGPQLQALLAAFLSKLRAAQPQHIANTMYAVVAMGQQLPEQQLQLMLAALTQQLQSTASQDISNSLWACARNRHLPEQLLAALEEQKHLGRFLAKAEPQHLANTAWACGQLGYACDVLFAGLIQQALQLLQPTSHGGFNKQDLSNISWAVAVLNKQEHATALLQLAQARVCMWGACAPQDLRQLYQVHIWLQQLQLPLGGAGLSGVLSQQQLQESAASWEQLRCSNAAATASQLQQQVFASMQQLPASLWQGQLRMEAATPDGNFSIDIAAVTAAGAQLAIEVDGPMHFVSPGKRVDAPTQFRNRMLAAQGYTVISIPYWEWQRELKGPEQQRQYLLDRLAGVLATSGTSPGAAGQPSTPAQAAAAAGSAPSRVRRTQPSKARPSTGAVAALAAKGGAAGQPLIAASASSFPAQTPAAAGSSSGKVRMTQPAGTTQSVSPPQQGPAGQPPATGSTSRVRRRTRAASAPAAAASNAASQAAGNPDTPAAEPAAESAPDSVGSISRSRRRTRRVTDKTA